MTWRELSQLITQMPQEVQDEDAKVWVPEDWQGEQPARVTGVTGFYCQMPIETGNPPSIDIEGLR